MIDRITNDTQYSRTLGSIDKLIVKATNGGGFNSLTAIEQEKLGYLSLLAEQYEDNVIKIMPLSVH